MWHVSGRQRNEEVSQGGERPPQVPAGAGCIRGESEGRTEDLRQQRLARQPRPVASIQIGCLGHCRVPPVVLLHLASNLVCERAHALT